MLALSLVLAVTATPGRDDQHAHLHRTVTDTDVANWSDYAGDELQMLIRAAWTEGEAAERNITVTQQEIDEEAEVDLGYSRAKREFLGRIGLLKARIQDRSSSRPPRASRRTRSRPT